MKNLVSLYAVPPRESRDPGFFRKPRAPENKNTWLPAFAGKGENFVCDARPSVRRARASSGAFPAASTGGIGLGMLSDRVFYPACATLVVMMVALALVWPQGEGAVSPWPFGHMATIPSWVAAKKHRDEMRARQHKPAQPAVAPAKVKP